VAITTFTRQLNLPETLAMSVALMAPTTGMVFVTPFLAAASGCNVPLAFVVSLIGVLVIGFSFGRLGSLNDRVKPR
jgi:amino acid transporter